MKRIVMILTLALASAAVLAMSAAPAFAAANWHYANASKSGNNLVVSFKETGLGDVSQETITVNVETATAEYGCFNRGGNHPEAANKETVSTSLTQSGTFPVRNGQTTGSITVSPPGPGAFSCPNGQQLRLISASYSGITITGAAGTISTTPSSV